MIKLVVPLMLLASSVLMAFAWLGHIRFRSRGFWVALLVSWFIVLPEYALNVSAMRLGHGVYSGGEAVYSAAQMAAINLCTGILCIALVSRFFLKERLNGYQISGFVLMALAIVLVVGE
ncbi:MAG: DMT family protein [Pirellulales bacterium]|nr:DMT family protein [Planctomycetales bacterium]